jgi:hypothetical protein
VTTDAHAHCPSTTWRGLSGPFTCTGCGKDVILDGDAAQTVDGTQKLCRTCNQARLDAIWNARPPGIYRINIRDHGGTVLATGYVRHRR